MFFHNGIIYYIMVRIVLIVLLFLGFQSCTQAKKSEPVQAKPIESAPTTKANPQALPDQYAPGISLKETLLSINLKNPKDKAYNMKEFVNDKKKNVIILVKQGCIFCNSLIALMQNKSFNANVIMVADTHTSFEDFVKKSKENKAIKAQWAYDYEGKFQRALGMNSYPNILVLDNDLTVIEHQRGLKRLEDNQGLENASFAVALQKMALNTVNWLGTI